MKIEAIAKVCHEANRAYCAGIGDLSQVPWEAAPEWQAESAISGVQFVIDNPDAPASANHDSWLKEKAETGWVYGEEKDEVAKTHPCMVPFEILPLEQQRKDVLFRAVVGALLS